MKVREQIAYSTSNETVGTAPAAWSLLRSWALGQSLEQPSGGSRRVISLVLVHPILICHPTHPPIEWDALSPLHLHSRLTDSTWRQIQRISQNCLWLNSVKAQQRIRFKTVLCITSGTMAVWLLDTEELPPSSVRTNITRHLWFFKF